MKKGKKKIIIIIVAVIAALVVIGALSGNDEPTENSQVQVVESAAPSVSSNLGDYEVVIDSCRLSESYDGTPIVIVKYIFTNNDDEPSAFWTSVEDAVFQDGIGLNKCYLVTDSANYSIDNQQKEIKKGASISVEVAYELNDTETDIEVEVTEYFSLSDKKVTKIFSIK